MFTDSKHIERWSSRPDNHESFVSNWETPVVEVFPLNGCYEDGIIGLVVTCCVGTGAEDEF